MLERRVTITVSEGLHARPAAELVRLATEHEGSVRVRTQSSGWVDARSVIGVMMLAVDPGESVVISAEGERASAVLDEIETLLVGGSG